MTTLILTEKPSVAKDFASALGVQGKKDGYFQGQDFIITWAIGHLVELAEPAEYGSQWSRWSMQSLPILPDRLKYKPIDKVRKQLGIIQQQLGRNDIEQVVIATDAGREGEVIARTILQTAGEVRGNLFRFWTSQALTPQVVRDTMSQLRPASEYDRLWEAGRARQIADWLVGMNFSRAATLRFQKPGTRDVFSVGRVQTAVLALIVDRKRERENFKPQPYWVLRVLFSNEKGSWWGTWFKGDIGRFDAREDAEKIESLLRDCTGKVRSVKREKKKQVPPVLYSLTDLQRDANAKFGLSAKDTLDIAQKLYETRKCLSYPRTDSRVLGSKNVDMARKLVEKLEKVYQDLFRGVERKRIASSNKRVFNDAKLTDHHALVPLAPLTANATENERRIYDLVLKRFAAAFHPDYEYEATEVVTEASRETFRTKGSRPLVHGWKAVYGLKEPEAPSNAQDEGEEMDLPPLVKGDPARVDEYRVEEKMTQPPPEYTEALLLKDMTNPSRFVSEEELQKVFKGEVGLGTQATRAQIIETLLARAYVVREKKKLVPTEKGCILIDRLRSLGSARSITAAEETARWEMELEKIALGIGDAAAFMEDIRQFVKNGVEEFKAKNMRSTMKKPLGQCPACGGEIIEGRRGFGCSNWKDEKGGCRFVIWKEINGVVIKPGTVRILLSKLETLPMRFQKKNGDRFTASLQLVKVEEDSSWELRFIQTGDEDPPRSQIPEDGAASAVDGGRTILPGSNSRNMDSPVIGQCPSCGGDVLEGKKGFGCSNWKEEDGGCPFVVWKVIAGKEIPKEVVQEILEGRASDSIEGFMSKRGKPFSARLVWDEEEQRVTFVF